MLAPVELEEGETIEVEHANATRPVFSGPSLDTEDDRYGTEMSSDASQGDIAAGLSHTDSPHSSNDDIGRQLSGSSLASSWVVQEFSPPVRLRMTSCDKLCARAMQIEWENGTGIRQRWLSSEDPLQNGWYRSEKILSPSATNITVQFFVRSLRSKMEVCMVDRRNGCAWVLPGKKRYAREIICFRVGAGHFADPIDAIFELKGPMHGCFVNRAWNAATLDDHEEWECWDDEESRPPSEDAPATLLAAEDAAPAQTCEKVDRYYDVVTRRLCAAAHALLSVHRETCRGLRGLDVACSGQWMRGNVAATASAGMMVAAVPCIIVVPPVGIGLAIAGGLTGAGAMGGGAIDEKWSIRRLNEQMTTDSWNAFVTAELLREWLRARTAIKQDSLDADKGVISDQAKEEASESSYSSMMKSTAYGIAMFSDEAAIALPILGPVGIAIGAVLTTGVAIHGWTSRKFSQKQVRAKVADLRYRILFFQFLLARLGELHCPICLEVLTEKGRTLRCEDNLHYCHVSCAQAMSESPACAVCAAPLAEINSSIEEDVTKNSEHVLEETTESTSCKPEELDTSRNAFDENNLLEIQKSLDKVAQALSNPPQGQVQVLDITAELQRCEAARVALEDIAAQANDIPKGDEVAAQIAETLERITALSIELEKWVPSDIEIDDDDEILPAPEKYNLGSDGAKEKRTDFRSKLSVRSALSKARNAASYSASSVAVGASTLGVMASQGATTAAQNASALGRKATGGASSTGYALLGGASSMTSSLLKKGSFRQSE